MSCEILHCEVHTGGQALDSFATSSYKNVNLIRDTAFCGQQFFSYLACDPVLIEIQSAKMYSMELL
jgi:hypothetical protein